MSRKSPLTQRQIAQLLALLSAHPMLRAVVVVLALVVLLVVGAQRAWRWYEQTGGPGHAPTDASLPAPGKPGEYLFCFWNVENLFDDKDDGRAQRGDKEYDAYFSGNDQALKMKLARLCDVLGPMNTGRGPDILAVAEVESERAVELLQQALNARLNNEALSYKNILFENPGGGRHIGTAILTRLPVEPRRTQLLGRRLRILEGRINVNGHPLTIIASHWSSRISDKTGEGRGKYGDVIYGRFKGQYLNNPAVDLLVCGDFNDNPDEPSVTDHLHAVASEDAVRNAANGDPLLFNVFAKLCADGAFSHYYRKGYLFDQICISPGLLDDQGWTCDVRTAQVVTEIGDSKGRPNRFGGESDRRNFNARGASDHFPVTVQLRVRGSADTADDAP